MLHRLLGRLRQGDPGRAALPRGKESGQTNRVERFNNTLRQRLAQFVRQTLSFSKSDRMHKVCLLLFVHDYNRSKWINNNT